MSTPDRESKTWSTSDYKIQRVIGEGSYGRALLATDNENGQLIVVKEISLANLTPQEIQDAKTETKILSYFKHPNIVGYYGDFIDKNIFHIVMEYADGGDLSEQIENASNYFTEDRILDWFIQICLAIKHIHDRKIVHRDLKAENVFLMKNGTVKLGDFGIAKILDKTTSLTRTAIGTPYNLSPEICLGRKYNGKSDIWSLGCILYQLCTLKHPFDSNSLNGLMMKITKSQQAPIPSIYSSKLAELTKTLLQKQPNKRPTINQILNIDFIHDRIGSLLSSTLRKIEFSHTVFHGYKGGVTPDNLEDDEKPSKKQGSKLPVKRTTTAKGTRTTATTTPAAPAKTTSSKPAASQSKPAPKTTSAPKPAASKSQPKPAPKSTSATATTRQLTTSSGKRCSDEVANAAAADRKAQVARREAAQVEEKRKAEEAEKKRLEFEKKQMEKKKELAEKQKQLHDEEIERQKKFKNLEAPIKKTKKELQSGSQSPTKPKAKNEKELTKKPGDNLKIRENEVKCLNELIRQKKAEAAKLKKTGQADFIQIGNMKFDATGNPIEEQKSNSQPVHQAVEDTRAPMRVEDLVINYADDDEDDDDLMSLAVIAQNMHDHPPSDDEDDYDSCELTAVYTFKDSPLPMPSEVDTPTAAHSYVKQFIEKGIGADKFNALYKLVKDNNQLNDEQVDAELNKILKSPEEIDYYPLVQQYVIAESVSNES